MQTIVETEIPYSAECESGVIGCCMLEPELLDEVAGQITADDFYDLRHSNSLRLMLDMRRQSMPIDLISIREEAKSLHGGIQSLGGLGFLSAHQNSVPSGQQLPYYISIVKRKSQRRKLLNAARQIVADSRSDNDAVMEEHSAKLNELLRADTTGGEVSLTDALRQVIDEIESAQAHRGCTGVSTGLPSVDYVTGGLQKGDTFVIAARPSMGKTALAMSIACNVAMDQKVPVGVISMEMTAVSLIKRMVASRSGVDGHKLINGGCNAEDVIKVAGATQEINEAKDRLLIEQTSNMSPLQLLATARRWKLKHGIELLVIDYLQLMRCKADGRVQEVAIASAATKQVAKELNIPVIVLSQLNRGTETQDRSPRLSDLKESGAIEQDADLVGLLYKPDEDQADTPNTVRLNIAKHRNGPTGFCDLEFLKEQLKFREYLPTD